MQVWIAGTRLFGVVAGAGLVWSGLFKWVVAGAGLVSAGAGLISAGAGLVSAVQEGGRWFRNGSCWYLLMQEICRWFRTGSCWCREVFAAAGKWTLENG